MVGGGLFLGVLIPKSVQMIGVCFAVGDDHAITHGGRFVRFESPAGFLDGDIVEKHFSIGPDTHALRGVTVFRVAKNGQRGVSMIGGAKHRAPTTAGGVTVATVFALGGQVVAVPCSNDKGRDKRCIRHSDRRGVPVGHRSRWFVLCRSRPGNCRLFSEFEQ